MNRSHRYLARSLAGLAAFFASGGLVLAQETHPFSIHDMLAMDRVSDPQVSPDGKRVVFVIRKTDLEANRGRTDLWLVNIDGPGLRQLTTHPDGDSNPRWSPDGKTIYFLSTRSGSSQVWKIASDGGEAEQVTDQPLDVDTFVLSPDGKSIALAIEVFPDLSIEETKKRLDEEGKKKSTGQIYDRLFIRHWDTWEDGRRSHVFVMGLSASGEGDRGGSPNERRSDEEGAAPVDVMKGMDADCPSKPFGGPEEFAFTPDGKSIVFTAKDAGKEEAWSTDFDLYVAAIDGSTKPKCLTESNQAWDTTPAFSPDGKMLAYLAMRRPGYEADAFRVILQPWPEGPPRAIQAYDSIGSITWLDNKTLLTTSEFRGQRCLKADKVPGPAPAGTVEALESTMLACEGTVAGVSVGGGAIVYGLDHLKSPVELYTIKPDGSPGSPGKQITNINAEKLAAARMGDFEQFTFNGWNDEIVHAYVVKPADFDASKKYPVAFLIHGGPQGSFGNHFHYRWNPQAYAGAGYAAVMVDFHGSTGYGQDFCDSIRGDWGGKPLEDLQRGLAAALRKYPWLDRERVGALGASYGGYMINWIAGNWRRPPADELGLPDFRALVCHDGNIDEQMA